MTPKELIKKTQQKIDYFQNKIDRDGSDFILKYFLSEKEYYVSILNILTQLP